MRIQGKQLTTNTIELNKLNLSTPVNPLDATRKDYVDGLINNSVSIEQYSDKNLNMIGLSGSTIIYLVCNESMLDDTVYNSVVSVYVNGMQVNCGENQECFFSPDGIFIREIYDVRIGDRLYWNTEYADYDIDENDIIDFKYLTNDNNIQTIDIENGEIITISDTSELTSLKFIGDTGTTATIIINNVSFGIEITSSGFIFDTGNTNGLLYEFTYLGENYPIIVNSNPYNIIWNGISSIIFSVVKNYPFDITRWYDPIAFGINVNSYIPNVATTNTKVAVGSDSYRIYVYDKLETNLWGNGVRIHTFSQYVEYVTMSDDYVVACDSSGLFIVFKWDSISGTWDSGTTLDESTGNGYSVYSADIDDNQIVISNDTSVGFVKVFTENSGGTWDSVTLTVPTGTTGSSFGFPRSKLIKNNKIVTGTANRNMYIYHYNTGTTSWDTVPLLLDKLPGDLTDAPIGSTDNRILGFKDDLILCGAFYTNYYSDNPADNLPGVAYIYEYSGGTWWLSQLPFPTGNTDWLLLGSSGGIGVNIVNDDKYLFVTTRGNTGYLASMFVYEKSGSTWEIIYTMGQNNTDNSTYGETNTGFDIDNNLNIVTNGSIGVWSWLFFGKEINFTTNRTGKPIMNNLIWTGTELLNNYVTLSYDYFHPTYVDENVNSIKVEWTSKTYLDENYSTLSYLDDTTIVSVDSNLYGKHVQVIANPVDINNNIGVSVTYTKTLLKNNNSDFNTHTPSLSQSITLIISSGSINGNGPGVYILLGNSFIKQDATTSSWGLQFSAGAHRIYLYGTISGYNNLSLTINGATTWTTFTDTEQIGYISDNIFTSYNLGGVTFTLSKNTGWR